MADTTEDDAAFEPIFASWVARDASLGELVAILAPLLLRDPADPGHAAATRFLSERDGRGLGNLSPSSLAARAQDPRLCRAMLAHYGESEDSAIVAEYAPDDDAQLAELDRRSPARPAPAQPVPMPVASARSMPERRLDLAHGVFGRLDPELAEREFGAEPDFDL